MATRRISISSAVRWPRSSKTRRASPPKTAAPSRFTSAPSPRSRHPKRDNRNPFSALDARSRLPMMNQRGRLSLCSAGGEVRERVLARTRSDKSLARFDRIALVLSGGGALGAYQAGAYAALENRDVRPNWIAGTAIGALNAAIIAGNLPHERVLKLRQFWQ